MFEVVYYNPDEDLDLLIFVTKNSKMKTTNFFMTLVTLLISHQTRAQRILIILSVCIPCLQNIDAQSFLLDNYLNQIIS